MSLRTKSALCLAAAAVLAGLPAFPQDAGLSRLYYYGLYQEIGLGDIAKAIETYRRATEGAAGEKSALAGKALLRMGLCCEKMGKRVEARDAFNRAIANFSAFPSIVETASEGLIRLYADRAPEEDLLAGFISRGMAAAQQGDL
ncbi:MAG: tetratricopeptide repeat protein [Candidatus Aureabacteria bacterium]|nr:tetratricopeptide repeat protein [Candidatus Auribacterota bacterium]